MLGYIVLRFSRLSDKSKCQKLTIPEDVATTIPFIRLAISSPMRESNGEIEIQFSTTMSVVRAYFIIKRWIPADDVIDAIDAMVAIEELKNYIEQDDTLMASLYKFADWLDDIEFIQQLPPPDFPKNITEIIDDLPHSLLEYYVTTYISECFDEWKKPYSFGECMLYFIETNPDFAEWIWTCVDRPQILDLISAPRKKRGYLSKCTFHQIRQYFALPESKYEAIDPQEQKLIDALQKAEYGELRGMRSRSRYIDGQEVQLCQARLNRYLLSKGKKVGRKKQNYAKQATREFKLRMRR